MFQQRYELFYNHANIYRYMTKYIISEQQAEILEEGERMNFLAGSAVVG
jgi:hypothetical protein